MVFNSLGSNYNFHFVLKSLFSFGSKKDHDQLVYLLEKRYSGKAVLLYKGREAIKLTLKILDLPKGSRVGIIGFTCFAVYQAVKEAGCAPVFIDIERGTLNFGLKELQKQKDLKALIIQNTLGISCEIEGIQSHCKKNNIYLIEDLAHSIGTVYHNHKEAGTCGDFIALSFSQDKAIDAVSGGALIIRNKMFQGKTQGIAFRKLGVKRQIIDRFYPILTYKIRLTYGVFLGKVLHWVLKETKLLSEPMPKGEIYPHELPNWYCSLIIYQFLKLSELLKHRQKIASIYKNNFKKSSPLGVLRFPIFVKNKKELIRFLKNNNIYVSDIWYDAPIAPSRYLHQTNYHGECPIAEKLSRTIINLPTHINISEKEAERISALVNQWLNTNQK